MYIKNQVFYNKKGRFLIKLALTLVNIIIAL